MNNEDFQFGLIAGVILAIIVCVIAALFSDDDDGWKFAPPPRRPLRPNAGVFYPSDTMRFYTLEEMIDYLQSQRQRESV